MDLALLFPPLVRTALHGPPTGVQQLAWHIKAAGYSCDIADLNLAFCREVAGDSYLDALVSQVRNDEVRFKLAALRAIPEATRLQYPTTIPLISVGIATTGRRLDSTLAIESRAVACLIAHLTASQPRVVGISIICNEQVEYGVAITQELKKAGIAVVWGGPEITGWAEPDLQRLQRRAGIDVIVKGDGEYPLQHLMKNLQDEQAIVRGTPVPLSKIDIDAGFQLDPKDYAQPVTVNVIESKGCYWNACTHCDYISLHETVDNSRRTELFVRAINRYVENTGYKRFHFINDTLAPGRAKRIAAQIRCTNSIFSWNSFAKIDKRFDLSVLEVLPGSGCEYLIIGLESLSDGPLDTLRKGYTADEACEWIAAALSVGVNLVLNLIVGIPGSTEADDSETLDRLRQFPELAGRIKVFRFVLGRNTVLGRMANAQMQSTLLAPFAHRGGSSIAVAADPALDQREKTFREAIMSFLANKRESRFSRALLHFAATGEIHGQVQFSPTLRYGLIASSKQMFVYDHATNLHMYLPPDFDIEGLCTHKRCGLQYRDVGLDVLSQLARSGSLNQGISNIVRADESMLS